MYDIDFFEASYDLKRQIVRGDHDLAAAERLLDRFERLRNRKPHLFNVETTNYCNMRCVMCPRTTLMQRKNQWIDNPLFQSILEQITPQDPEKLARFWRFVAAKYGIGAGDRSENHFYFHTISRCLTLHGYGEPLLDRHIVERIAACSERDIPSYFSCTPANITVDKARALMEAGLGVLKFSLDALTDEKQKSIRGRQNDFTNSFQNILDILELKEKHRFATQCVVVMIDLSEEREMVPIVEKFEDLWREKDIYYYVKNQDNRWYFDEDETKVSSSHYNDQYCEFPWISMSVMANGQAVPCTQDYDAEMAMGAVADRSLADIWNGESYQRLRWYHMTGRFPKGHKCNERCDLKKAYQYLRGR